MDAAKHLIKKKNAKNMLATTNKKMNSLGKISQRRE